MKQPKGQIKFISQDQNEFFTQGERFSVVRMGSQVDCIIPLVNKKLKFESLVDVLSHVEAGVDPIIRWSENAETKTK